MSAIGSIGSNTGFGTLFQRLSATQSRGSGKANGPTEAERAEFEKKFEDAAKAAGLDIDKLKSIQGDIQSAISAAMQNYSNSTDKGGMKEAVQATVNDVLEKNGFDPATVKQQLTTARESLGMGKMPPGPPPGPPPDKANASDGTTSTSGTSETSKSSFQSLMDLIRILEDSTSTQGTTYGQADQIDQSGFALDLTNGLDIFA